MKDGKGFFRKFMLVSIIAGIMLVVGSFLFEHQVSQIWQAWGAGFFVLAWVAYCVVKGYEREEVAQKAWQERQFYSLLRENFYYTFWLKFNARRDHYQGIWNLPLQEVFLKEAQRAYAKTAQELGQVVDFERATFDLYCEVFEELYNRYQPEYKQGEVTKEA